MFEAPSFPGGASLFCDQERVGPVCSIPYRVRPCSGNGASRTLSAVAIWMVHVAPFTLTSPAALAGLSSVRQALPFGQRSCFD
jgi:hypothetical protein